jgi:hypothetical protein
LLLSLAATIAACQAADNLDGSDVGHDEHAAANDGWRQPRRTVYFWIDGGLPAASIRQWVNSFYPGGPLTFIEGVAPANTGQIRFFNDPDYKTKSSGLTYNYSDTLTSMIHVGPLVTEGTIHHEMGHAVGLVHEHERPDRCENVIINCNCTTEGCIAGSPKTACEPYGEPADTVDWEIQDDSNMEYLSPYDLKSVMQYNSFNDGGTSSCRSIKTIDGKTIESNPNLSVDDRNALWAMYFPQLGVDETEDRLGYATASGDFDGDGYVDVAVGAPFENGHGEVFVYKGSWLGLIPWKVLTEADFGLSLQATQGDAFGMTLAAGNLDDDPDGTAELFVGAIGRKEGGQPGAGAVFMYKGLTTTGPYPASYGEISAAFTYQTPEAYAAFGQSMAVMTKGVDGRYLAIGAPMASSNGAKSGTVTVMKWANGAFQSWQVLTGTGFAVAPADGDMFGWSLAAGDLDGDGYTDLAVGSPESTRSPNTGGAVYLFHDDTSGLVVDQKLRPSETQAGDHFGYVVAAGNIDGSYGKELVVSAPVRSSSAGKIYVYTDVLTSGINMYQTSSFTLPTITAGDLFGAALDVGDVDKDGYADIVVGSPGWSNGQGKITILHGEPLTPDRSETFTTTYASEIGSAVAIGQFDGGFSKDVAIGCPHNGGRLIDFQDVYGMQTYDVFDEAAVGLY